VRLDGGGVAGAGGTGGMKLDGGGGTGGSMMPPPMAPPPDPQAVKFCNDLAKVSCDKLQACEPGVLKAIFADVKTCQDRQAIICAKSPAVPGVTMVAATQAACIQARSALSCEDYFNDVPVAACDFKGTGATGAACISGLQCQTGNCVLLAGQTCGACAAYLPSGAACNGSVDCAPGLSCVTSAAGAGICAAFAKAGAACNDDDNCGYGLLCGIESKKCVPWLTTAGAACTMADDLCSNVLGFKCDPAMLKCVPLKFAATGETCDGGLTTYCLNSGYCVAASQGAMTGTCMPPPDEGKACRRGTIDCYDPTQCTSAMNGVCVVPTPLTCQ
jgi:hypothetical protein